MTADGPSSEPCDGSIESSEYYAMKVVERGYGRRWASRNRGVELFQPPFAGLIVLAW
jgi:hypothetical protein